MRPIVFVGPSITRAEASELINADFRPPCRRGDVSEIPPGCFVGLIDGVFRQTEAVSPGEIRDAIRRGVRMFGSSSMGALRAVEVPGMHGVGHIVEMYRTRRIDSDDEVAVAFDPETMHPLTVPLVNVRYAARRLRDAGSISAELCRRIIEAAERVHYTERTYRLILRLAGISNAPEVSSLIDLLAAIDLKRDDARLLLQLLSSETARCRLEQQGSAGGGVPPIGCTDHRERLDERVIERRGSLGVLVWEIGSPVEPGELIDFLALSGSLTRYALPAAASLLLRGRLGLSRIDVPPVRDVKTAFARMCDEWGWRTQEEIHVSLADCCLDLRQVARHLRRRTWVEGLLRRLAQARPAPFVEALLAEMAADDMSLKREVMRCVSLRSFGAAGYRAGCASEGRQELLRQHGMGDWRRLGNRLKQFGVRRDAIAQYVVAVGAARRMTTATRRPVAICERLQRARAEAFGLGPSPKPEGEWRFTLLCGDAVPHAHAIADAIGVTRIGMINRLANGLGVHVSQVARPEGAWSSSYGSGKSEVKEGAIIGGVMEEAEKWAQERYRGSPRVGSYAVIRGTGRAIDPRTLDLPYDSDYEESLEIEWQECHDLITGHLTWAPLAALACPFNIRKANIYYSRRGARGVFSTNGLASGFSLTEAVVHASCEYIERHAVRMAELRMENPGTDHERGWPTRIDPDTLAPPTRAILNDLVRAGFAGGVWDITSEVRVPTMTARLIRDDGASCRGSAAHPNPRVAAHMALLEAVQSIIIAIAGGREDITIHARSLGRHERPRPARGRSTAFWRRRGPLKSLDRVIGLVATDAYDEYIWVRDRLVDAGVEHMLAVDLSREEIGPARVVRVVVPGLETSSPFYTGPRARLALVADLIGAADDR